MSHVSAYTKRIAKYGSTEVQIGDGVYSGHAVSVTPDGQWLAVGGGSFGSVIGFEQVIIYKRTALGEYDVFEIIPKPSTAGNFGCSLDISADGLSLVVGDRLGPAGNYFGSTHIFRRANTTTTFGSAVITKNTDRIEELGIAVAISADGNVVVSGGPRWRPSTIWPEGGRVYVWVWTGSSYTELTSVYSPTSSGDPSSWFGRGLAVSRHPSTSSLYNVVVGSPLMYSWGRVHTFAVDVTAQSRTNPVHLWQSSMNVFLGAKVASSPDGRVVAASRSDGQIFIWEWNGSYDHRGTVAIASFVPNNGGLRFNETGEILLVGSPILSSTQSGKIDIIKKNTSGTWYIDQTLTGPAGVQYGTGVDIADGDNIVFSGAPGDTSIGTTPYLTINVPMGRVYLETIA